MEKTGAITQWQIEGTISAVPAPFFLHPAEEESAHRRPKAGPPAWAQAPAPLAFPRTLFSSCLLPTTVDFPPLQNYGSGDRNDPPGLAPPFIHCPTFFFFWFLLTTQLLGKCLHQLFSLPYLSFAQQPIPTWLPFRQLNLNGSCRLTSTLPAAKTAEHISVFTSLSLSEAFNPVG